MTQVAVGTVQVCSYGPNGVVVVVVVMGKELGKHF